MRRVLVAVGVLALAAAVVVGVAWQRAPRAEAVAVDAAAADAARASGGAAAELRVEREGVAPATLSAARALWEEEELASARASLEAALAQGSEPEAEGALHALLAVVCRRQRDADAAVAHGRRAAELLATSSAAHHVYARAIAESMRTGGMLAAMRNVGPWRAELRTAIELDPTNVEARLEELLFYAFVPRALGGDPTRADELLAELDEHDPVRARALRSRVLQHREELDGALAAVDAALAEFPGEPELLLARADLRVARGELDLADTDYARAAEGRPDHGSSAEAAWRAVYQRANAWLEREVMDADRARQVLGWLEDYAREAPRGDYMPGPARVDLARARALARLDRPEDAAAAYRAARAADENVDRDERAADELRARGVPLDDRGE